MQRTRIKICGLTRIADVQQACALGVDAIGFVRYPASPRFVDDTRLAELARALPPLVTPVLLFVNADKAQVHRALAAVPNALLQFHGAERADYCEGFGRPFLRAIAVGEGVDLLDSEMQFPGAAALLVDAPSSGFGGSGRSFPWERLPAPARRTLPLVLAGGLQADNVVAAIGQVRPYAVDVSSGVETAPGIKSVERMREFIEAVHRADAQFGAA